MEAAIFFWLAGSIQGIIVLTSFIGGVALLAGVIGLLIYLINRDAGGFSSDWKTETYTFKPSTVSLQVQSFWKTGWSQFCLWIGSLLLVVSAILPSKDTMYLMAGGFMGQHVVMSDTAMKIKQIVDLHLDEQLKKLTK